MREVKDLAATIKEAVAGLKKSAESTRDAFHAEVQRAVVNADKLRSFTMDLREANVELEAALGDTGSNFPSNLSEESNTQQSRTDVNGVTVNTNKE